MADEQQIAPPPSADPVRDATGTIVDQTPKLETPPQSDSSSTQKAPEGTESPDQKTSSEKKPSLANTKPEEGKAEDKPAGPPEKYEPFKAPEGFEFNDEKMAKAGEVFKELGLTQEGAQKLVDTFAAELTEAIEAPFKAYQDIRDGWRSEVIKDPALGNGTDGLKPEVKAAIGRVIDNGLGAELGAAFREAMDFTGAGDNPAFIRGIMALSKFVTEGTPVKAGGPVAPAGTKKPSAAQALYPSLPSAG